MGVSGSKFIWNGKLEHFDFSLNCTARNVQKAIKTETFELPCGATQRKIKI